MRSFIGASVVETTTNATDAEPEALALRQSRNMVERWQAQKRLGTRKIADPVQMRSKN